MKPNKIKWEWTWEAELAFRILKRAFSDARILTPVDPSLWINRRTDASHFTIAAIVYQYGGVWILRLLDCNCRKWSGAGQYYDIYLRELFDVM